MGYLRSNLPPQQVEQLNAVLLEAKVRRYFAFLVGRFPMQPSCLHVHRLHAQFSAFVLAPNSSVTRGGIFGASSRR